MAGVLIDVARIHADLHLASRAQIRQADGFALGFHQVLRELTERLSASRFASLRSFNPRFTTISVFCERLLSSSPKSSGAIIFCVLSETLSRVTVSEIGFLPSTFQPLTTTELTCRAVCSVGWKLIKDRPHTSVYVGRSHRRAQPVMKSDVAHATVCPFVVDRNVVSDVTRSLQQKYDGILIVHLQITAISLLLVCP